MLFGLQVPKMTFEASDPQCKSKKPNLDQQWVWNCGFVAVSRVIIAHGAYL